MYRIEHEIKNTLIEQLGAAMGWFVPESCLPENENAEQKAWYLSEYVEREIRHRAAKGMPKTIYDPETSMRLIQKGMLFVLKKRSEKKGVTNGGGRHD